MATTVTINGTQYTLPDQSENEPWGADLSDLIEALVEVANASVGAGDILATTSSITNNVSSPTNVSGLQFDIATILSSVITYTIYRSSATEEFTESGTLILTYLPDNNEFDLAQRFGGTSSGVDFTITGSGQIQYTSSNMNATNYTGSIDFFAKSILQ